ncbi:MAG: hypothetical protein ABIQ58_07625 [Candidatus Limnocylindrales bacterium]
MHLVILLAVGGFAVFLIARLLAAPGSELRGRHAPMSASAIGLAVGLVSAMIALSTQTDLVPDDIESAAVPVAILGISAALGVIAWQRTFGR